MKMLHLHTRGQNSSFTMRHECAEAACPQKDTGVLCCDDMFRLLMMCLSVSPFLSRAVSLRCSIEYGRRIPKAQQACDDFLPEHTVGDSACAVALER